MVLKQIILFYDVFMPSWINSRFNSFCLTIVLSIYQLIIQFGLMNFTNKTGYSFTYFDVNNSKKTN